MATTPKATRRTRKPKAPKPYLAPTVKATPAKKTDKSTWGPRVSKTKPKKLVPKTHPVISLSPKTVKAKKAQQKASATTSTTSGKSKPKVQRSSKPKAKVTFGKAVADTSGKQAKRAAKKSSVISAGQPYKGTSSKKAVKKATAAAKSRGLTGKAATKAARRVVRARKAKKG